MSAHLDDHVAQEEGDFQCEVCNRIFSNLRLYRIHKRLHSSQNKSWSCEICGKKYRWVLLYRVLCYSTSCIFHVHLTTINYFLSVHGIYWKSIITLIQGLGRTSAQIVAKTLPLSILLRHTKKRTKPGRGTSLALPAIRPFCRLKI